jgi:anti-anti-sigma regulatory factor
MLRVTLPTANNSGVIVLEGRLTGLWSQVLLLLAREEIQGHGKTFDLREVLYVDSAGENALQTLGRTYGASFIA